MKTESYKSKDFCKFINCQETECKACKAYQFHEYLQKMDAPLITKKGILGIVDDCFYAYASFYRVDARIMAEQLIEEG